MSTLNASPGFSPASSPAAAAPVSYEGRPLHRRPRVSLRLVMLLGLLAAPFLYFGYVILDQSLSGGVTNRGSYYEVDLKSLGYFPFDDAQDSIDDVPARWRALDGKRVALHGEMYAPESAGDKVTAFQLVYSIQKCCFNGPPRVQERVFASVPNKGGVDWYNQVVRVVGTLRITAKRNDVGVIEKLYELDVESVDPA